MQFMYHFSWNIPLAFANTSLHSGATFIKCAGGIPRCMARVEFKLQGCLLGGREVTFLGRGGGGGKAGRYPYCTTGRTVFPRGRSPKINTVDASRSIQLAFFYSWHSTPCRLQLIMGLSNFTQTLTSLVRWRHCPRLPRNLMEEIPISMSDRRVNYGTEITS